MLNQMPKNRFKDVLPVGEAATMSARASESAMTAKERSANDASR